VVAVYHEPDYRVCGVKGSDSIEEVALPEDLDAAGGDVRGPDGEDHEGGREEEGVHICGLDVGS